MVTSGSNTPSGSVAMALSLRSTVRSPGAPAKNPPGSVASALSWTEKDASAGLPWRRSAGSAVSALLSRLTFSSASSPSSSPAGSERSDPLRVICRSSSLSSPPKSPAASETSEAFRSRMVVISASCAAVTSSQLSTAASSMRSMISSTTAPLRPQMPPVASAVEPSTLWPTPKPPPLIVACTGAPEASVIVPPMSTGLRSAPERPIWNPLASRSAACTV